MSSEVEIRLPVETRLGRQLADHKTRDPSPRLCAYEVSLPGHVSRTSASPVLHSAPPDTHKRGEQGPLDRRWHPALARAINDALAT